MIIHLTEEGQANLSFQVARKIYGYNEETFTTGINFIFFFETYDKFSHILKGYSTGIGAIIYIWLPQCSEVTLRNIIKISQPLTTTNHNKHKLNVSMNWLHISRDILDVIQFLRAHVDFGSHMRQAEYIQFCLWGHWQMKSLQSQVQSNIHTGKGWYVPEYYNITNYMKLTIIIYDNRVRKVNRTEHKVLDIHLSDHTWHWYSPIWLRKKNQNCTKRGRLTNLKSWAPKNGQDTSVY